MAKISDIVKGAAFYKCTMDHGSPFTAKESLVALWRKRPNLTIRFIHHLPKYLSTKWKQSYIILIELQSLR